MNRPGVVYLAVFACGVWRATRTRGGAQQAAEREGCCAKGPHKFEITPYVPRALRLVPLDDDLASKAPTIPAPAPIKKN